MAVFRARSTTFVPGAGKNHQKTSDKLPYTSFHLAASRQKTVSTPEAIARKQKAINHVRGAKKIRVNELPAFSRQLSALILAGMPLIQSLNAMEDHTSNKNFKFVIAGIKSYIQGGASFSEALSHYPSIFDKLYLNMIKAGEQGGQVGETAARLSTFLEASAQLRRKIKSAMMYPIIALSLALLITTGMMLFIVPVFADMFAEFGAKLPLPTQIMIAISSGIKKHGILILAIIALAFWLFTKWKNTSSGSYHWANLTLHLPVLGMLNQKVATSRFARTFAQLLKSGVPILQAMEIVSGATGNKMFEVLILNSRQTVERGEPLSSALVKHSCFPRLMISMLAAGEDTGKIDDMVDKCADFYDDEIDTLVAGLTSLIEPLLIVVLGVIIGSIVLSIFAPIFKLGEVVM